MTEVIEIIIRVFVAFIVTLIITRLIGKQMIAQLTYHDFVAAITIACVPECNKTGIGRDTQNIAKWKIILPVTL